MITIQEFYDGYDMNYTHGSRFTIDSIDYVLIGITNNEFILMNATTYEIGGRYFKPDHLSYNDIKNMRPSAASIVPANADRTRRLPPGSIIVSNNPVTGRELQLVLVWNAIKLNGQYYFVNTQTGLVDCAVDKSSNGTGINTTQFALANIGTTSDWEIVKVGIGSI